MSGEEELTDKDPFDDDQGEDLISVGMVKKATYLIHKLATRKGADYKDIQNKCKKLFAYTNLAKVSMDDGHKIINKLIELTGGEEEEPQPTATQLPTKPSEPKREIKKQPAEKEKEEPKTEEEDVVTATMRKSIRAAVDITLKEIVAKEVPVQGLGGVVLEISKVIFEAKMSAEDKKHDSKRV